MHRQPEHVMTFLLDEMGTSGSLDVQQRLVVKGGFAPKNFEGIVRRYISKFRFSAKSVWIWVSPLGGAKQAFARDFALVFDLRTGTLIWRHHPLFSTFLKKLSFPKEKKDLHCGSWNIFSFVLFKKGYMNCDYLNGCLTPHDRDGCLNSQIGGPRLMVSLIQRLFK